MRPLTLTSIVLFSVAFASTSLADDRDAVGGASYGPPKTDEPRDSGVVLGARLGLGLPMGNASGAEGAYLSRIYSAMVPVWFDLGYRPSPNWYLGAYFQYGFGFVSNDFTTCSSPSVSCSVNNLRLGFNVHYHVTPRESVDPWIGIGSGWEGGNFSASGGGSSGSVSFSGFEIANLQLGLDFRTGAARFGPFAALSVAQYSTGSMELNGTSQSRSIDNQALHEWLMLGIRSRFDL